MRFDLLGLGLDAGRKDELLEAVVHAVDTVASDLSSGAVPLPSGIDMRTPDPDNVDRALLHQWNVTLERRLPFDLVTSVAYVGTQTNGGYAYVNVNHAEPGTGNI